MISFQNYNSGAGEERVLNPCQGEEVGREITEAYLLSSLALAGFQ